MVVMQMMVMARTEGPVQQSDGTRFRADAFLLLPLEKFLGEFARQSLEPEFTRRRPDANFSLGTVSGLFHGFPDLFQPRFPFDVFLTLAFQSQFFTLDLLQFLFQPLEFLLLLLLASVLLDFVRLLARLDVFATPAVVVLFAGSLAFQSRLIGSRRQFPGGRLLLLHPLPLLQLPVEIVRKNFVQLLDVLVGFAGHRFADFPFGQFLFECRRQFIRLAPPLANVIPIRTVGRRFLAAPVLLRSRRSGRSGQGQSAGIEGRSHGQTRFESLPDFDLFPEFRRDAVEQQARMVLDGRLNVVILLATGTVFPAGRSKVAESSVWKIRKYKKNGRTLFLRKAENRKIDGQRKEKKSYLS